MTGFRSQRSGCLSSVTGAVNRLLEVGVHVPEWQEIADGLRPEDLGFAEWEPCEGRGWQRHASATVHEQYREQVVWPHLSLAERALVRSQSGPLASVPFTALPIHRISKIDPDPFRELLLRRLHMPLPLNVRACRCGRLLDVLGHHRAAGLGSWAKGGSLQKVLSLRFAGKAVRECPPTSCCWTWTFPFHIAQTDDVWKWWLKGYVCSAGASLLWMPQLSPRSTEMEHTGGRRTWWMEWR